MRERPKPPRLFQDLDDKWGNCYLEGAYRKYPLNQLVTAPEDGQEYCRECYHFRWHRQHEDDAPAPDVEDDD